MSDTPTESLWSRGYLPHLRGGSVVQFVTWRLVDSMPAGLIARWMEELGLKSGDPTAAQEERQALFRRRLEKYLDQGAGRALLRDPRAAQIVRDALLQFDGQRYRLVAWVIMPNHVHVLVELPEGGSLSGIVHSWKSFTAKAINRVLGRTGAVWYRDYYDRFIRTEGHLVDVVEYIHNNPVKAGLILKPEDWRFSSAWIERSEDEHAGRRDAGGPRRGA